MRRIFFGRAWDLTARSRRHEEASRWFVMLQEVDKLSPRLLKAWQKWEAVPENRRAFETAGRAWRLAGELPRAEQRRQATSDDGYDGSISVAQWRKERGHREHHSPPARFQVLGLTAALALVLIGFNWIGFDSKAMRNRAETGVAQHLVLTLEDGTRVHLGSKSLVTASFSASARTVVLHHGEALFEVAKDPRRPFHVDAGAGRVTAVGTSFVVRRRSDNQLIVTVNEGVVEVARNPTLVEIATTWKTAPQPIQRLEPGQEVSLDASGRVSELRTVDTQHTQLLLDGRLTYRGEPLSVVIQDVNRYSPRHVEIGDAAAGNLRYSGTVFERDITDWLAGIGKIFPELEVVTQDDQVLIRTRRPVDADRR